MAHVVEVDGEVRFNRSSASSAISVRSIGSWNGVAETGRSVRTERHSVRMNICGLLGELGVTDDALDVLLLLTTQLIVAPPDGTLVFALEVQMSACLARRFAFVAFFAS